MTFIQKIRQKFAGNSAATIVRDARPPVKKLQYGRRKNMVDYRDF
ncbi:hypothetical protein [Kordiimonas sp. SCSIO 12610]|nr:hypothetical protein [Kordiimonas sp. SCSIO 12610]